MSSREDAKRLIVTADDFGLTRGLNEAVLRGYREGILRYASLMVDAPYAGEAVAIAKKNPGLGVGIHVELCRENPALWGIRYFGLPSGRRAVEPLLRAQIEKFLAMGLKPTHIDGHFHLHAHPTIFPVLTRLAREYGIPRTRLPNGEWRAWRGYEGTGAAGRAVLAATYEALGRYLRKKAHGVLLPERTWGLMRSGRMSEEYVVHLLSRLPQGLSEIYFHPSAAPSDRDASGRGRPTSNHHSYEEFQCLRSPLVREALAKARIELVEEPRSRRETGG